MEIRSHNVGQGDKTPVVSRLNRYLTKLGLVSAQLDMTGRVKLEHIWIPKNVMQSQVKGGVSSYQIMNVLPALA